MSRPRIFISQWLPPEVVAHARQRVDVDYRDADEPMPPSELARRLAGAAGLVCLGSDRIDAEVLAVPGLKVVANVAVGYNNIDVAAATARGVVVTNTPGVLDETTADLAFGLMLAVARRIVETDRFVRSGAWRSWKFFEWLGADVHGKTLGIVGLGRIGRAVARRARAFGMTILYTQRRRAEPAVEAELAARYVDKATLLASADFVTLHCPLTPETTHYIDAEALARMKPTAFLINTSRGPVVDERALVAALRAGRLAGAALDVFEREPAVEAELLTLPTVVLTPHIGSGSTETRTRMARLAVDNCVAVVTGGRPLTPVNPEVLAA
ncbi:MAG TPA: D-glycerate dehydrogenase [Thermodesulfobacteriota bacterium]|nr:D-glycerate dehydrogenase [Thermodesulfobacteriota bacterium]